MALKTVSVEVSAASYDFTQGVVSLVKTIKEALDDGLQLDQDIAKVLPELVSFAGVVRKAGEMSGDADENVAAFIKAMSLSTADLAAVVLKKKPAELAPPAI